MLQVEKILLLSNDTSQMTLMNQLLEERPPHPDISHITHPNQLSREFITDAFDVIVFDMGVLDDAHHTYEWIRKLQAWDKDLAIIALFEEEDEREIIRALGNGVQDYLIKSEENLGVVKRALRYAVQRKRYEEKIAYLTMQDHLTGLMNGELIPSSLRQAIYSAKREQSLLAVYYVDIDHFKAINDLHGHDVGNALLIDIASRLQTVLDENSMLARLSGDTFIIIDIADDLDACAVLAEEIISSMQVTTVIAGISLQISASIGVATYPECGKSHTDLMKHAEMALHQAKEEGRGKYRFYSHELNEEATRRIHITSSLKQMADDDMFSLKYQPKIHLATGEVTGVEALIRWQHPEYGDVSPSQFIPLAEEAGLIHHISSWVAKTACLQHTHTAFNGLEMCINISAKEMCDDDTVEMIRHVLEATSMPPDKLVLELTETATLASSEQALEVMHALKGLGVKLYLDDFGTGYSSIDYLRRYPVDALKIDRSFISHMHEREEDVRLVRLMIDIAHELGRTVIAEGIERAEHLGIIKEMGCDEGQGYFFARPMSAEAFIEWQESQSKQASLVS